MYAACSGKSGPLHIQRQTNTCASTATKPESANMEAYMEPGNFKYVLYRPWMVQICLGLSYSTWSSCSILEVRGWFHCQSHRRGYLKCSYFLQLNDSFLPSFFFLASFCNDHNKPSFGSVFCVCSNERPAFAFCNYFLVNFVFVCSNY